MEWLPIESAPKDGRGVFAFWRNYGDEPITAMNYGVTMWARGAWIDPDELDHAFCDPNYWMPLPPPPTA